MKHFRLLPLVLLCFITACQKKDNRTPPVITVSSPATGQSFTVGDTIRVSGTVQASSPLNFISLSVTDAGLSPVLPVITLETHGNSENFSAEIPLNNLYLESGSYYLLVRASDEALSTNSFTQVNINGVSKQLLFTIVLTRGQQNLKLYKVYPDFSYSGIMTLPADYSGSGCLVNAGLLVTGGRYNTDIVARDVANWQNQWTVPVTPSAVIPYFDATRVNDNKVFVSYRDGHFEMYNRYGQKELLKTTPGGYAAMEFALNSSFLITFQRIPANLGRKLVTYHNGTFAQYNQLIWNLDVVKLLFLDENNCFVFCNNGSNGYIKLFAIPTNSYWDCYAPAGPIRDVSRIDGLNYLVAAGSNLLWLNHEVSSLVPLLTTVEAGNVFYDNPSQAFVITDGPFRLSRYLFPSATFTHSIIFSDSIVAVHPVFNKD